MTEKGISFPGTLLHLGKLKQPALEKGVVRGASFWSKNQGRVMGKKGGVQKRTL